jgi:putative DNA primase/helicase
MGMTPPIEGLTAMLSDVANAERLQEFAGDRLRCVSSWGSAWLVNDGKRWDREHGNAHVREAISAMRAYFACAQAEQAECQRALADVIARDDADAKGGAELALKRATQAVKHAIASQGARPIAALLTLAAADPKFSVHHTALDADPWLLNVANGTVDLRSGGLRPHDPLDLVTRLAPVDFDPNATCPTWEAFLSRVMGGNAKLVAYLQRAIGYSITGLIREHVVAFNFGGGANGKSTFHGIIHKLLGTYAVQAPRGLLFRSKGDRHPTEFAGLCGARFVTCSEIEQGQAFDEALVKDLTGGDLISTRRMREDFWSFPPTHKLWIAGNHKPTVRGDDDGIWRRIRLVPWNVQIPIEERDSSLPAKLEAELSGILAWAVRGCLAWQETGLGDPIEVTNATAVYRDECDPIGDFFRLRVTFDADAKVPRKWLRHAYEEFAEENGEKPVDAKTFAARLKGRGVVDGGALRQPDGKKLDAWRGVRLATDAERDEPSVEGPEGRGGTGSRLNRGFETPRGGFNKSDPSTSLLPPFGSAVVA